MRSPAREMILPRILPGADHLIAYHVVTGAVALPAWSAKSRRCSMRARSLFLPTPTRM